MMTAEECIRNRRSIRKFTEEAVPHALLSRIVETASYAPSWKNTQIVRYIAVEGGKKAKLAQCTNWAGNTSIMESAPVVIAVTLIKGRCGYERDGSFSTPKGDRWQMYDAGAASEAFCLAACEQGLGTVIMGLFDEEKASQLLELPQDRELAALFASGIRPSRLQRPAANRRQIYCPTNHEAGSRRFFLRLFLRGAFPVPDHIHQTGGYL